MPNTNGRINVDIEQEELKIPIMRADGSPNEDVKKTLEQKIAEGWQLVPGTIPVATYQLMRVKSRGDTAGITAEFGIDDEKVMIIRADGSVVKN